MTRPPIRSADRRHVLTLVTAALAASLLVACEKRPEPPDAASLDAAIALAGDFLIRHQTERGDFTYEYDFVTDETTLEGSQVRQAGALWGVALLHRHAPSEATRAAMEKGLAFWEDSSVVDAKNRRIPRYPGAARGDVGTVALLALSGIDFLRAEFPLEERERWERFTLEVLAFLMHLRRDDGHWHQSYRLVDGAGYGDPSPYYDGESLLALAKAVRFQGLDSLQPFVMASAERMYAAHVVEARKAEPDSPITKGFYQWGSMAFREMHDAGWDGEDVWARRTIELANWMIDTHRTLERRKNTAYAQEGIVSAYALATAIGEDAAARKLRQVIERGLGKLMTWQVGSPRQNDYAEAKAGDDPLARGGVMNAKDEPVLRIDVTQHQLHAMLLARQDVFR